MSRSGRKKKREGRHKIRAWLATNQPPPPIVAATFKKLFGVDLVETKMILLDDIAP